MDATRFLDSLKRARLDLLTCRHMDRRYPSDRAPENIESAFATITTLIETVQEEELKRRFPNADTLASFEKFGGIKHARAK